MDIFESSFQSTPLYSSPFSIYSLTPNDQQKLSPKIEVFDRDMTPVGWLDRFDSLQWVERPSDAGWFELWCPLDEENSEILKEDNLIWQGDESCAYIESIKKMMTPERGLEFQVRGKMVEDYFNWRIVWGQYIKSGQISDILRDIVNISVINPTNANRIIPRLQLSSTQPVIGPSIDFQNTGGTLHDVFQSVTETYDRGWELHFDPFNKSLTFVVTQGVDRTQDNTEGNDPVVFDSDMEDILSSSYFYNKNNLKNVALVAGAGEGAERKTLTVNNTIGLDRRELFVDARDLSDTDQNMDPIPPEIYNGILLQRGQQKLDERRIVETFDAKFRTYGNIQYQYGLDYRKGDWVTVQDRALNITISAKVTEVQKIYDSNGFSLNLTFGYTQPTLNYLIKHIST